MLTQGCAVHDRPTSGSCALRPQSRPKQQTVGHAQPHGANILPDVPSGVRSEAPDSAASRRLCKKYVPRALKATCSPSATQRVGQCVHAALVARAGCWPSRAALQARTGHHSKGTTTPNPPRFPVGIGSQFGILACFRQQFSSISWFTPSVPALRLHGSAFCCPSACLYWCIPPPPPIPFESSAVHDGRCNAASRCCVQSRFDHVRGFGGWV